MNSDIFPINEDAEADGDTLVAHGMVATNNGQPIAAAIYTSMAYLIRNLGRLIVEVRALREVRS